MARVTAIEGDLTKQATDAIVNAANPAMLGGGGVDGAIHRAAGRGLVAACREVPVGPGGRCPTGEARITPGFDLPARFVIHTVGPIWGEDPDPQGLLLKALRSSLALAEANDLRTVAVPAISTGVYGFPMALAADLMVRAALAHEGNLEEIRFVLWGAAAHATFAEALARAQA